MAGGLPMRQDKEPESVWNLRDRVPAPKAMAQGAWGMGGRARVSVACVIEDPLLI